MLTLKGNVLQSIEEEMTTKKGEKKLFTTIQMMVKGKTKVFVQNIRDWECRKWEKGEQEIPVYVNAFVNKSGGASVSYNAA